MKKYSACLILPLLMGTVAERAAADHCVITLTLSDLRDKAVQERRLPDESFYGRDAHALQRQVLDSIQSFLRDPYMEFGLRTKGMTEGQRREFIDFVRDQYVAYDMRYQKALGDYDESKKQVVPSLKAASQIERELAHKKMRLEASAQGKGLVPSLLDAFSRWNRSDPLRLYSDTYTDAYRNIGLAMRNLQSGCGGWHYSYRVSEEGYGPLYQVIRHRDDIVDSIDRLAFESLELAEGIEASARKSGAQSHFFDFFPELKETKGKIDRKIEERLRWGRI